jgi:hypothetical protein
MLSLPFGPPSSPWEDSSPSGKAGPNSDRSGRVTGIAPGHPRRRIAFDKAFCKLPVRAMRLGHGTPPSAGGPSVPIRATFARVLRGYATAARNTSGYAAVSSLPAGTAPVDPRPVGSIPPALNRPLPAVPQLRAGQTLRRASARRGTLCQRVAPAISSPVFVRTASSAGTNRPQGQQTSERVILIRRGAAIESNSPARCAQV